MKVLITLRRRIPENCEVGKLDSNDTKLLEQSISRYPAVLLAHRKLILNDRISRPIRPILAEERYGQYAPSTIEGVPKVLSRLKEPIYKKNSYSYQFITIIAEAVAVTRRNKRYLIFTATIHFSS